MITDRDIYAAANLCIEQHGDAALILATRRADELRTQNDIERQRHWIRIVQVIKQLQRKPAPGARMS